MKEYVPPQTYSLLAVLSSAESLQIMLALLEEPATVEELADRTGISRSTLSRRLDGLSQVGLTGRSRPHGAFEVAQPELFRQALEALSNLATAILKERLLAEETLNRSVRRTRLSTPEGIEPTRREKD
jgi:DNA-binding MarR family transcriptional regulator